MLGVAEQADLQLVLGDELAVALGGVRAAADDGRVQLLEVLEPVREVTGLGGAAGRVVVRIK